MNTNTTNELSPGAAMSRAFHVSGHEWLGADVAEMDVAWQDGAHAAATTSTETLAQEFARLHSQHAAALTAQAGRLTRNRELGADLVQDTFERALRYRQQHPPVAHERAWLLTILRNLFISKWRKERVRAVDMDSERKLQRLAMPDPEPEPEWAAYDQADVERCLADLPAHCREAFQMHAIEGLSYADIAARTGVARMTVGTRIFRARTRLRRILTTSASAPRIGGPDVELEAEMDEAELPVQRHARAA